MPDYPNPATPPALPPGPQFPFSRALTSGPLGDLLAGLFGAPGDLAQMGLPKNDSRFANVPTAPTYQQLQRGMEEQNARPPALTYQGIYAMLPELSMLLRGAPQPGSLDWMTKPATDWDTKIFGGRGDPPEWFKNLTGLKGFNSAPDTPQTYQGQNP